jgi:hypothetical protein
MPPAHLMPPAAAALRSIVLLLLCNLAGASTAALCLRAASRTTH